MKKIALTTAILLLAVTAFGQERERSGRPEAQDHKSEATVRRSAERNPTSTAHTTQRVQKESAPTQGKTTYINRTQQVNSNRIPQGTVRTYNGKDKPKPAGTVRTPAGNGNYSHAEGRKHYATPDRKPERKPQAVHAKYTPVKYHYAHSYHKVPDRVHVVWTHNMYREYRLMYPDYHYWYYPAGYRIVTVPCYKAYFHIGEVRNIYGRIHEVWYSWSTDEYYLYFGSAYPYQDFTVIVEGREARRFNRHPEAYFAGRHIWVTGLVSNFEGKPEIMVKRNSQIHLY